MPVLEQTALPLAISAAASPLTRNADALNKGELVSIAGLAAAAAHLIDRSSALDEEGDESRMVEGAGDDVDGPGGAGVREDGVGRQLEHDVLS